MIFNDIVCAKRLKKAQVSVDKRPVNLSLLTHHTANTFDTHFILQFLQLCSKHLKCVKRFFIFFKVFASEVSLKLPAY